LKERTRRKGKAAAGSAGSRLYSEDGGNNDSGPVGAISDGGTKIVILVCVTIEQVQT
jgi:hypothetical protein